MPEPLQDLAAELAITIANSDVWLSIALALLLGGVCLVFGIWAARTVGLLWQDAPAWETLGVGLATGLMLVTAWWAALWSGGRSSFTPVAIGFAIAVGLGVVHRVRRPVLATAVAPDGDQDVTVPSRPSGRRALVLTLLAAALFVVAVALLYGSTIAPSPRDGVQPVEFTDEAFYSILGRDLAATGTETSVSPSGFSDLPGVPAQTWYHWGEVWLASIVITIFGVAPIAARHFIVLPLVLLAAAALTGTLVWRIAAIGLGRAAVFGIVVCLFLSPLPLLPGPFFSASDVGLIFGITTYGLAAVAVLLAMNGAAVLGERKATWELAGFLGSATAFILPAHVLIAVLACIGVGSAGGLRILQSLIVRHRPPSPSLIWRRTIVATIVVLVATVAFGTVTDHGLSGGASPVAAGVSPFNETWRTAITATFVGGGVFFAIAVAWLLTSRDPSLQWDMYVGAMAVVIAGAIAWGARLSDFTMFHAFYGGIAVFATPVAAVAVGTLLTRFAAARRVGLAAGLALLCVLQLEWGVLTTTVRMQTFGAYGYEPISVGLLATIRNLAPGTKLAYSCATFEEIGFATPRLLSIDAHTGQRVVPMCYAAEVATGNIGGTQSIQVPNLYFASAPQRMLFPDASAHPSPAAVLAFLKDHDIGYIYADAAHPNTLVPEAVSVATSGDSQVLRVP